MLTINPTIVDQSHFAMAELPTGVTLNYLEQGNRQGEAIIMLHGLTDSWHSYSEVVPRLPQHYRLIALDLRGHGNSSKPASGYTVSNFAADVIALMDRLEIKQANIVGHSMGSLAAQMLASRYASRVSRLVLMGTLLMQKSEVVAVLEEEFAQLADPIDPEFAYGWQMGTIYRQLPVDFMQRVIRESLKAPAHVWQQSLAAHFDQDHLPDFSKIVAPTLVLWGDHDQVCSYSDQQEIVARIPHAELVVYEQTGHAIQWEQPMRVAADIARFLQAYS